MSNNKTQHPSAGGRRPGPRSLGEGRGTTSRLPALLLPLADQVARARNVSAEGEAAP